MKDTFEFTLNNPLTEEQWDMISDVDFDRTDRISFHTKHGKEVEFAKVIRCKDCFWYRSVELKADGTHDKRFKPSRCALWDEDMNDTDFCSYAMPKEADE